MSQARVSAMALSDPRKRKEPGDGNALASLNKIPKRTNDRSVSDTRGRTADPRDRRSDARRQDRRGDGNRRDRPSAPVSSSGPGAPPAEGPPVSLAVALQVPQWYEKMKYTGRANLSAQKARADVDLGKLQARIERCRKAFGTPAFTRECDIAVADIHKAMFLDVDAAMVRNHFLLSIKNGLPVLICEEAPWYVCYDATELFGKWAREIFTSDMFHGLKAPDYDSIIKGYPGKRSADAIGHNGAVTGHWVPTQLCLVRDGIHGSAMGGIYGKAGRGAYSLVMAGGMSDSGDTKSAYENVDLGDELLYCGTDSVTGSPSANTQLLLDNIVSKQPVRFIRSYNAPKPFAPQIGYRYDGLYDIVDSEVLNADIQRYRFKLVRCPGQVPLRYDGPGVRPTSEEVLQASKIKYEKQFYQ